MLSLTSENFREEVLDSTTTCIVTFKSNGCHLCRGLDKVLFKLRRRYAKHFKFGYVDMDTERRLAKIFSVDGVPTIFWFRNGDGEEVTYPGNPNPFSGYSEEYLVKYFGTLLSHE